MVDAPIVLRSCMLPITTPTLPKGGGAITGIGETFQQHEFTGTAGMSIPIHTSACRGFEPHLSDDYSSGSGNGVFGIGWGLAIPNISRKTSKGTPRYDDNDAFILSNAEELVLVEGGRSHRAIGETTYSVVSYRPRVDDLFAKIEQWSDVNSGESFWRVISSDNVTSVYGPTSSSRISQPGQPTNIFQWLLHEVFDHKGNRRLYEYTSEAEGESDSVTATRNSEATRDHTTNRYLSRIRYANESSARINDWRDRVATNFAHSTPMWHLEVVFDYGDHTVDPDAELPYLPPSGTASPLRRDPFSTYHAGFEIRTRWLCRNILMFHRFPQLGTDDPVLAHATRFQYNSDGAERQALLRSVTSTGYRYEGQRDEAGRYRTGSLPALEY